MTIVSCATTREAKIKKFKELTKDMHIETKEETRLVQLLYLNIVNNKKEYYEKSTSYSTLTLEIREGSGVSLFSWNYYVQRALFWIEAIIGIFISLSIAVGPLVLIYFVVKRIRSKS